VTSKKRISVVVSCYDEAENIGPMHERLSAVLQSLDRYDYEILFVDNDSIDDSSRLLTALAEKDSRVKVLFMSRNFGSPQPSFLAGLAHCRGHAAVLLHGDIQDPPELIPQFVEKWEAGYEVVYGVSRRRDGFGPITNLVFRGFYALLARMAYISIPLNAGEFSLIGRRAIDELLKIDEYDYYIRCLRAYVGFKQTGIEYERSARSRGKSTQNPLMLLWWAKTLIVNFSFKPLEWIALLAMAVVLVAFVSIIVFLISYAIHPDSPRGIPTLFVLILFLGGVQLLALSVVAEYLAKIFLEVKRRPRYIVRDALNLDRVPRSDGVHPADEGGR
jgi:glycosyltransferase involved in cell wall biosynthesis